MKARAQGGRQRMVCSAEKSIQIDGDSGAFPFRGLRFRNGRLGEKPEFGDKSKYCPVELQSDNVEGLVGSAGFHPIGATQSL
jgi:hypothetical protein